MVVSNAFGSVTSSVAQIDVNGSLTEGLVGWWKFDEIDGNIAYDSSGNNRDGNFSSGGTWVNGKIGGAIDLNGSSVVQILNYKGVTGTQERSVSCWLKSSSLAGDLFFWGDLVSGSEQYYALSISTSGGSHNSDNGSLKLAIRAGYKIGQTKVNSNQWFHVVLVSAQNSDVVNSNIYLNSSLDGTLKTLSRMINTAPVSDLKFGIGGFTGLLDDIRIYDRALSAFEVKALYELGEQPVQESGSGTTTVVNGTVADGSITASKIADQTITTNQLSEQILKYLKPEITAQPQAQTVYADTNATFSVTAEGKYLTYQWKKRWCGFNRRNQCYPYYYRCQCHPA